MIKGYPVLQRWLREDIQDRVPVTPRRQVIHSTANPGASDEDHARWLDAARRHGWANDYIDHDSISAVVPEGWRAPAQGPSYNADSLSIEMCEPSLSLPWDEQLRRFNETWQRTVWRAADRCWRFGWTIDAVNNHAQVSAEHPDETDHQDPLAFFARYGRTWEQFIGDVQALLDQMNGILPPLPPGEQWKATYVTRLMERGMLSERRHPNQPVLWWEQAAQNNKLLDRMEAMEAEIAALRAELEKKA